MPLRLNKRIKGVLLVIPKSKYINQVFNTKLVYHSVSVDEYETERKAELGDFLGTVIAGIYNGIRMGVNDVQSDFEKATGRAHKSPLEMMGDYLKKNS